MDEGAGDSCDLPASSQIEEPACNSRVPVLGPVIAGSRAAFTDLALRPYVVPLMQQQNELNARAATSLAETKAELAHLTRAADRASQALRGLVLDQQQTRAELLQTGEALNLVAQDLDRFARGQQREVAELLRELTTMAERLNALELRLDKNRA